VFYPCMSYNVDEGKGDNCYNCPVVAYYPEVIGANMECLSKVRYIYDYIGLHRRKDAPEKLYSILGKYFAGMDKVRVKKAFYDAFAEYGSHMERVSDAGAEIIGEARREKKHIVVLAGRPYHADAEINHGIDRLITSLGTAVVSEDAVAAGKETPRLDVLNQWTYHTRLYAAAEECSKHGDMSFVQLVSFGCGCDAVTTDECRRIVEGYEKIYTQIKIDEIENLGAAKIRLRSLFAALETTGLGETR